MPEQATVSLPPVALIFGDADAVQHVRAALTGHVAIVYDAQAATFDDAQLAASGARAALVNLDSYEWLDTLTAKLGKAGVAAVFNDPETSAQLDGWERARWLRHLVAKLRGSDDYDPPRPVAGSEHGAPHASFAPTSESVATLVPATPAVPVAAAREQPLSSHEIESLTADFSGVAAATPAPKVVAPAAAQPPAHAPEPPMATTASTPVMAGTPPPDESVGAEAPHLVTAPLAADDFDPALDVDTEALSAMIDARLAEPEREALVHPVIADDLPVPGNVPTVAEAAPAVPVAEVEPEPVAAATPSAPPSDDADVLADLPALGDWALVDADAPIAAASNAPKHAEPTFADSLDGIELVPMDNNVPAELHMEPVEHRLYGEVHKKPEAANDQAAGAHGDHA